MTLFRPLDNKNAISNVVLKWLMSNQVAGRSNWSLRLTRSGEQMVYADFRFQQFTSDSPICTGLK